MILTNDQRAALRKAVNAHPGLKQHAPDVHVSSLGKAELLDLADQLGIDVRAYVDPSDKITRTPAAITREETETMDADTSADKTEPDPVDAEVSRLRGLLATGGFAQLDTILTDLVRKARKPADVVYQAPLEPSAIPAAKPVRQETWRNVFGIRGVLGARSVHVWDAQDAPAIDQDYVWPEQTAAVLSQIARRRNVFLTGPAGTGKTSFAEQVAARLRRPFTVISCDGGLEAIELVGQELPAKDGGTVWRDGQLMAAIKRPGTVVLLDEPSVARPSALFVFQHVLQFREIYNRETGLRVPVAPGVIFIAADNTNGTGGGARRGYTDTNRLNAAFMDRWGIKVHIGYLPADKERKVLAARTGCVPALADILIAAANLTRVVSASGNLVAPISLRQLISWAELLTDGIDVDTAFQLAVLNAAPENDVETLRQQCLVAIDRNAINVALGNAPTNVPANGTGFTPFTQDNN